jgi:general secretion pathway protein C
MSRCRPALSALPNWLDRLLLVALCWQLSGLFWALFFPVASDASLVLPRLNADQRPASRDAFLRWYGADGKAAAAVLGDYTLMAVIAGENGVALLKSGEKSVAVRVGGEIQPGSRLVAVEPKQITIEQDGVRKEVSFASSSAAAPLLSKAETAPRRALPTIRLTRGQMAKLIQGANLDRWDRGLAVVSDGGVRIENASSQPLVRLLQLKSGDILKRINQRPFEQLADISLIFHFFGQSAPVDIVLVRNSAQLTQHYEIQP